MPNAFAALKRTAGGAVEDQWFQPCLSRLPMGDTNAVDFASIAHWNILLRKGVIKKHEMMKKLMYRLLLHSPGSVS